VTAENGRKTEYVYDEAGRQTGVLEHRDGYEWDPYTESWKTFFGSLDGAPEWVVADLDWAIARAVRETWPDAIVYHSRHHLAELMREQAKADGAIPDYGEQGEPWQKALDGYYTEIAKASDPLTLKTDYDLQERLERDYLATLSPEMRAIVLRETTFSRDPHYRELKEDRAKLEPFWAAQDDAFLDFRRNAAPKSSNTHVQAAQRFETMDEYREYIVAAVTKEADAKGLAPETRDYQIKQTVNKFFRDQKIDDAVQYYSSKVIAANTSLMDILRKWYPESVARYLLEVENKVEAGVR